MNQSQSRNSKCSCGSGKNYKNCCMKKSRNKKRFNFITYEAKPEHVNENGEIPISLFIDGINGKLDVLNANTNESFLKDGSKFQSGYFRESGKPKVLSEIPSIDGHHYTDLTRQILKYGMLVAIDTNTYREEEQIISIGIAHQVFGIPTEKGHKFHYIPVNRPFVIRGNSEKPENQNWMNLLKFITNHKNHNPNFKIGIIVDSDLGNISSFNQREKPIFEDYYLPDNCELIFASDAANDSFLNQAIKKCHSLANAAYKEFFKKKE